jgi:ABC-type antimicrobial peptide transport system permease subunit
VGPLDGWLVEMFLLRDRFVLYLVVFFSAAALVLAAVGLSGLLADSVARRRAELGVRQALGASPRRILVSVTLRGLSLALAGLAAGGLLVWLASGLTSALFAGSAAADPWSFLATAAVLSATALAASALPARRAARVHPAIALRGR